MPKVWLLTLSVILSYSIQNGMAQMGMGFKGGINVTSFDTEGFALREFATGYNLGAFLRIYDNNTIGFQTELLYSTKGRAGSVLRYELGYVEIPLLAIYKITENFHVQLGPQLSYLTDGRVITGNNGTQRALPNYNRNSFKTLDYGISLGGVLEVNRLNFGIRYSYGFNKVFRNIELLNQIQNLGGFARNSAWQMTLGYKVI